MPYMNPFDFVPFHGQPNLTTLDEWKFLDGGNLISGKIELKLKAITHLNITGEIITEGRHMKMRKFYRRKQDGTSLPCIPGSSIKGTIRSYIEALTNGFVSSYNIGDEGIDEARQNYHDGRYAKKKGDPHSRPQIQGRHIGFLTASYPHDLPDKEFNVSGKGQRKYFEFKDVLPEGFKVPEKITIEDKIDVASFLFGITALPVDKKDKETAGALRGRVKFSDIFFKESSLSSNGNHPKSLDIASDASFGAPNPSISNWWYFTPNEIRNRNGRAEFVGDKLRGRKFHFHQQPSQCISHYQNNWTHIKDRDGRNILVRYDVECIKADEISETFYITFNKVPKTLLEVFITALCPSRTVRYKLGALKPFGFGSVEFCVNRILIEKSGISKLDLVDLYGGDIFEENNELRTWANRGQDRNEPNGEEKAREEELADKGLVDPKSWDWLRFILHYSQNLNYNDRIFVYPPYNQDRRANAEKKGFAQTLQLTNNQLYTGSRNINIPCSTDLIQIAEDLHKNNKKLPIDFHVYQTRAENYKKICNDAGLPNFTHII